jgi:hypothetical protein
VSLKALTELALELAVDLFGGEQTRRADDLAEELRRIGDAVRVDAERADAHRPELRVVHHHGVRRAPLLIRELARVHEVHVALVRVVQRVLDRAEEAGDRRIVRAELVRARTEHVRQPPLRDEHGRLALADDELAPSWIAWLKTGKR